MPEIITRCHHGLWFLLNRHHTGPEVDYERIARLTREQARAVSNPENGVKMMFGDFIAEDEARRLHIDRVEDREPHQLAWKLRIGDEAICFIDDTRVNMLIENANPVFADGQPNWATREIERKRDQLLDVKDKAAALEAEIDGLVAAVAEGSAKPDDEILDIAP